MARKLGPIAISVLTAVVLTVMGGAYAAGDHFGFRPATIKEVRDLGVKVAANTDRSLTVDINNYDRIRERRALSRNECRRRNRIARALGEKQECGFTPPRRRVRPPPPRRRR